MYGLYCFCVPFDHDCKIIVVAFSDMLRCWRLFPIPCKPSTLAACEEGVERCCEVVLRDGSAEAGTLGCLLIGEGAL